MSKYYNLRVVDFQRPNKIKDDISFIFKDINRPSIKWRVKQQRQQQGPIGIQASKLQSAAAAAARCAYGLIDFMNAIIKHVFAAQPSYLYQL